MTNSKYVLEVDLGAKLPVRRFVTTDSIQEFIQSERDKWTWVSNQTVIKGLGNQLSHRINNAFANLNNNYQNFLSDKSHGNSLQTAFQDLFLRQRLPLSSQSEFQFIEDLRADNEIVAAAALTVWMGVSDISTSNFEHLKGAMLMVAFEAGIAKKTSENIKRSLKKVEKDYVESIDETKKVAADIDADFETQREHYRKTIADLIRQTRARSSEQMKEVHLGFKDAIESIRKTEDLYMKQMELDAPADYWTKKASVHKYNAGEYKKNLIDFAWRGGTALVLSLLALALIMIGVFDEKTPFPIYLILSTLGIVATTVVFWVARVLTRLYLSQHHLAIDAEERAVMAKTYLALNAKNAATDEDRAIVLSSLFRGTADGIVKDDGAPEFSPSAILSRIRS